MKVVTLKNFPFAKANSVVDMSNGYTKIMDNLKFKSGKFKYNLNFGTDIREFVPATDSSLPVAYLSKTTGDLTSDLGALSLIAFLYYRGYKQGKGVGYYVGYGILGWMGGGLAGRAIGDIFSSNYTGSSSEKTDTSSTNTSSSTNDTTTTANNTSYDLTDSLLKNAANKMSSEAKKAGNNISPLLAKTTLLVVSKNYTQLEKDVLAAILSIMLLPEENDVMKYIKQTEGVFSPLIKKYSETSVKSATQKVNTDMQSAFKKFTIKA